MTPEEQRQEEDAAVERVRLAFERHLSALSEVRRQFLPVGTGAPTNASLDAFEAAEEEWRAAQAEMDRITEEIRTGRRR